MNGWGIDIFKRKWRKERARTVDVEIAYMVPLCHKEETVAKAIGDIKMVIFNTSRRKSMWEWNEGWRSCEYKRLNWLKRCRGVPIRRILAL